LRAILADDAVVESGDALEPQSLAKRFPRTPGAITRTALHLFEGTSYQWGGVTPWGADCSGFVQTVFALHGIALPRDAHQQAEASGTSEIALADLHAADLLFFSERVDKRPTHVGIALDRHRMVHLALGRGGYAVDQLDANDDPYVRSLVEKFITAKRWAW
jgi:cell wall-associated NlpC family hydrolase